MRHSHILTKDSTALLVVDFQEKLLAAFDPVAIENAMRNTAKFIKFARIVNMPILCTEQYPKGLGGTVETIAVQLEGVTPIAKMEFSCFGNEEFEEALRATNVENVVITGVEAHICVAQTALDAIHAGYNTHVLIDAVESRIAEERTHGINKMRNAGAVLTSTEAAMYEVLQKAGTPEFKATLPLVK